MQCQKGPSLPLRASLPFLTTPRRAAAPLPPFHHTLVNTGGVESFISNYKLHHNALSPTFPHPLLKSHQRKEKKKENLSVWKSKVISFMHPFVFVSPARSTKDFSDPEAACNVSRAKTKMNDFATKQNGNLSPSNSSLTWNSPASDSHWHSIGQKDSPSKNPLSFLSLSNKKSRFELQ